MRSPFPGMDPYIEACGLWGDFHHDLISEIKHALAQAAPERYLVRAGERSYVVLVEDEHREAFVEIYEATPEQRLVTSIEILSPSNKRPRAPGYDLYLRKRQSLLAGRCKPGGDRPAPQRQSHAHARSVARQSVYSLSPLSFDWLNM
jgi:Protein of unknown function (DUF4058)